MEKPNIVFVLADDHGQWALGAYGNDEVISPNIDKLAEEGVRFDNFFCTSPVCSPARASILTGKMPSQHGVHDWLSGGDVNTKLVEESEMNLKKFLTITNKEARDKILAGRNLEDIDPKAVISPLETDEGRKFMRHETHLIQYLKEFRTYPQILSENGYECGMVGKWHLGDSLNKQCGFSTWEAIARGATRYTYPEVIQNGRVEYLEEYVTERITKQAIDFIDNRDKDKPFYLSVHYTAPHDPWEKEDQPAEFWDMYNDCKFENVKFEEQHPWQNDHVHTIAKNAEEMKYFHHGYYTCITAMDHYIGEIRKKLEAEGVADNTIIVFCGDNGMNLGQHGLWGKGNATIPQNLYDTSVKVPFIWYDPRTNMTIDNDDLLSQYDIMPTILEVCGIDEKLDETFPGNSFARVFENQKLDVEPVVVYDEYGPCRMIRTKEYKYVHRYHDLPCELYDLKNDIDERNNLIDDENYKSVVNQMRGELEAWFIKYVDPTLDGAVIGCKGAGQFERANRDLGLGTVFD